MADGERETDETKRLTGVAMMVGKLIDAILGQRLMVVSLSVLLLIGGLYAFKALNITTHLIGNFFIHDSDHYRSSFKQHPILFFHYQ